MKDDVSSIKLKLRWEGSLGSLFTLTLTSNTGYIQIQGLADKILALAEHIKDLVGGVVYSARQGGAAPHNPSEPEPEVTDHGATEDDATNHSATNHGANHRGASAEATDHGATNHGATEEAAVGTGTSSSSSGVGASPITGNGNVQVGTVVINTPMEDSPGNATSQNAMSALINGLMNLVRSAPAPEG